MSTATIAEKYSAKMYWFFRGCEAPLYYIKFENALKNAHEKGMTQKDAQEFLDGWNAGKNQLHLIEERTNDND